MSQVVDVERRSISLTLTIDLRLEQQKTAGDSVLVKSSIICARLDDRNYLSESLGMPHSLQSSVSVGESVLNDHERKTADANDGPVL